MRPIPISIPIPKTHFGTGKTPNSQPFPFPKHFRFWEWEWDWRNSGTLNRGQTISVFVNSSPLLRPPRLQRLAFFSAQLLGLHHRVQAVLFADVGTQNALVQGRDLLLDETFAQFVKCSLFGG